ncbi:heparinase II/III-like protein [Kribbella steppae]|uniref:Heparinase II/III-like protein n=1 Tax=Kribbella steppae TaxID=2512223 RepID=A0A4R2HKB3_9ACTN|nr:heparinase II/III family protein [Kribbella steppae]TCO30450.1 heparinase II/III-like protein [Kribbella steppae]
MVRWVLVFGLVVAGATYSNEAVAEDNPGIAVARDLPEPPGAQFVPGATNVVPATAAPASDIKAKTEARTTAEAEAAVAGTYTCPGFSSVDDATPLSYIMQDYYAWGGFKAYKVGNGSGNINWKLNPYGNPSWYMWFHSLRWLGQGIVAASQGDANAIARVTTIVSDWVIDNPYSWKGNVGAWESTMHRTNVIICTRQAVLTGLKVTTLPARYQWLDKALLDHAAFLVYNWSGAWNHGTDESIALFGVGCTLNRADYKTLAQQRLASGITTAIDSQGSTNEQSTAYAQFNYSLWGRAVDVLRACGADPGTTITTRRALMANWLALATNSLGNLHQIGDSEVVRTAPIAGTPLEYAGSLGATGIAPTQRVGLYSAGYVFGRSGWGTSATFADQTSYSIRYGPGRQLHGHSDHMSLTYTARGRDIVIDGGHTGYQNDTWRTWAKSPFAHSAMTTPLSADGYPATKLTRYALNSTSDFYEFSDTPGTGISRVRATLVVRNPDLVVTLDRGSAKTAQQFQTLWHLPSDQQATVYSRTTALAMRPGEDTRTILFQVPYRQALPRGAILLKQAQTQPIQGWHYPTITTRRSAPTLMFARAGTTASILSFIAPVRATGAVTYSTRWSGTTYVVDMSVAGVRTSIGIAAGGSLVRLA